MRKKIIKDKKAVNAKCWFIENLNLFEGIILENNWDKIKVKAINQNIHKEKKEEIFNIDSNKIHI